MQLISYTLTEKHVFSENPRKYLICDVIVSILYKLTYN